MDDARTRQAAVGVAVPGPWSDRSVEMINTTPTAVEKVKAVMEQEKESMPQGGLRIYVQGGGCSGFRTVWSSTR